MTIVEFLLARIAEDVKECDWIHREDCKSLLEDDFGFSCDCGYPERAKAECEAKRQIIELADEATGLDMSVDGDRRIGRRDEVTEPYLGDVMLRALALPYADRTDFDPAWRE